MASTGVEEAKGEWDRENRVEKDEGDGSRRLVGAQRLCAERNLCSLNIKRHKV